VEQDLDEEVEDAEPEREVRRRPDPGQRAAVSARKARLDRSRIKGSPPVTTALSRYKPHLWRLNDTVTY
jgi:hypothetical protein